MPRQFLTPIDLNKNELLNYRLQNLATAPGTPGVGQVYFDTADGAQYTWNGSTWVTSDVTKVANGSIALAKLATDPLARANHAGTQLATTISDLAATVKGYKLNEFAAPIANIGMGGYTLTGLNTTPDAVGQAAEYSWVLGQIQASAAGIDAKPSVNAVAVTNQATLSGTAQTVDGIALSTVGMRVLLTGQTTASQNGPWVVANGAWTRPVGETVTPQAFWMVEAGTTYGGSQWKVSTSTTIVLDTTSFTIVQFGAGQSYASGNGLQLVGNTFSILTPAGSGLTVGATGVLVDSAVVVRKYAADVGDGSSISYVITHNLDTLDVTASVYRKSGAFDQVECDIEHTSTNTMTLRFAVAPSAAQFRVVVHG